MIQPFRTPHGGRVDRSRSLRFEFDGERYTGHPGDTLASALLANGVRVVGRSFKYHRPRGIFGLGAEEPNALIQMRRGARSEPNVRATQIELFDGLEAESQNRWPSLAFDVGAVNDRLSRFLPAGFYYKTFMWPASWWMGYERVIRRAAGLGRAPREPDPDHSFKRHAHCDVLVVGAGPAGICAARAAAASGARVILVDEQPQPGGSLLTRAAGVDGVTGAEWAAHAVRELASAGTVRVLARATAFGYYDDNLVAVAERVSDHLAAPEPHLPRQRVWWIRARQVVLATGAIERPLVFPGNDRPGVMLASAAGGYATRFGVRAGRSAVLFTTNDEAYDEAAALDAAGVAVRAVVDSRRDGPGEAARAVAVRIGAELLQAHVVTGTRGAPALARVAVRAVDEASAPGRQRSIDCDLLCVSGGWNPTVHLFSQSQGRLRFDPALAAFVPGESRQPERSCGGARGVLALAAALADGDRAGRDAAEGAGLQRARAAPGPPGAEPEPERAPLEALWEVAGAGKAFVDLQNDVSAEDVRLAVRENYRSVEHLKRYTTLGMGTDQGRTSNVNGLAILASTLGLAIPEVGTTTFRPPYSPVPLGAVAGAEHGADYEPLRRSPLHDRHLADGAVMHNVGLWRRARYYPRGGEGMADAVEREVRHVRSTVGIVDVSTFGKIDVQGRDAAEFLDRVCVNRFDNLKIGRCRYHLMLREDGFVMDDGTTTRTGERSFYMTTTTAAAGPVMSHLEFYAQTVWPELNVHLASVSDQWGGLAIAGPRSRELLAAAVDGGDRPRVTELPFLASIDVRIGGVAVRVFRITFSGELGYELHMPADYAEAVWDAMLESGRAFGVAPYGTEAMAVMRIEKGHVVHAELDGRTTLADFGFDRMVRKSGDFVGRRAMDREGFDPARRRRLVGLLSEDARAIPAGAHLVWNPTAPRPMRTYGHVTSTCYSPTLERHVALAMIEDRSHWLGRTLYASSPLKGRAAEVRVVEPVMYDPDGARARG